LVFRRRNPKVYRVYKHGSADAVKLGRKLWVVYKFYRSKANARRSLEIAKWGRGRQGPMRVVLTNLGWAVICRSAYPARVLRNPR